ncbi:MAG: DUF3047 domain-containing protein [Roseinatronobacter sp.]
MPRPAFARPTLARPTLARPALAPLAMSRRALLAGGAAAGLAMLGPRVAAANPVPFDTAWDHLTFRRLTPNRFELRGTSLQVIADGSSSILYRVLPQALRGSTRASWTWSVENSVPPSDLSQIGNDDRNLGLFFVSMPQAAADRIGPESSIRRMMTNRAARVLMYTWGGGQPPGTMVPSPHAPDRLRNLIMRPAQPGQFSETVDLSRDFPRVFNQPLEQLVAVAVSSNSENSATRVLARVADLQVF